MRLFTSIQIIRSVLGWLSAYEAIFCELFYPPPPKHTLKNGYKLLSSPK